MPVAPELQGFLDKAHAFLSSAEYLLEKSMYESCISRAYYAAFYAVLVLLETRVQRKQIRKRRGQGWRIDPSHNEVYQTFLNRLVRPGYVSPEHGRAYGKLKMAREGSDYGIAGFSLKEARDLLEQARALVDIVEELLR